MQHHPKHKLFGKRFRVRPQSPCGRPDWDFIIKGFFDAGRTVLNERMPFEKNFTLLGTGAGLEFVLKRNVVISGDWGISLNKFSSVSETVDSGNNQFYFSATLLY